MTEQRPAVLRAGFFGVLLDEVDDAVDQRVREPLLDRALAPLQVVLALGAGALDLLGERRPGARWRRAGG